MVSRRFVALLAAFALAFSQTVHGRYVVLGGRKVRPFSDFAVAVTWDGERPADLLLELVSPGSRSPRNVSVRPGTTEIVTFRTGDLRPGNHSLELRHAAGGTLLDSTALEYAAESDCVFVHTDRSVYGPGDTIRFRVLALDALLKPVRSPTADVTLEDARGNAVRSWPAAPLTDGVFRAEHGLARFPPLGDWTLRVSADGRLGSRRVPVVDLVPPRFSVVVEAPAHAHFADGRFPVTVRARRHSGREVTGELTVAARPAFGPSVVQPVFARPAAKTVRLEGRATVEFDVRSDLGLTEAEADERAVIVEAAVEESLTGLRQNATAVVLLHRTRLGLALEAPEFYKPDLPYSVQLRAFVRDGGGPHGPATVRVSHGFAGRDGRTEGACELDRDGLCRFSFVPSPAGEDSVLEVEAELTGADGRVARASPASSPSGSHLQIEPPEREVSVGHAASFTLKATEPLDSFSYYVLGRGEVVRAATVRVVPSKKVEFFRFDASRAMCPEARLIVTRVRDGREMIAASLTFRVSGLFENHVRLTVGGNASDADIEIAAAPHSYVALTGGPPSPDFPSDSGLRHRAGEGSGLSPSEVLDRLRGLSGTRDFPFPTLETSVSHARELFDRSRVFLMTDHAVDLDPSKGPAERGGPTEGSTRPPLAGPYAFSYVPAPPTPRLHPGKVPAPAWLFDEVTLGADGRGSLERRVSDDAGPDWSVGAWAIHPTEGLGFAVPVGGPTGSRFLSVDAPPAVREGETFAVTATVFNSRDADMSAEVTLDNADRVFEFRRTDGGPRIELYRRRKLTVSAGRSASVVFFVTHAARLPLGGTVADVVVRATGRGASETVRKRLTLLPDGEETGEQATELLDLRDGLVRLDLSPSDRRAAGKRPTREPERETTVGADGSPIAPVLELLPRFLETPPASGYHNMLPFMASVSLLQYLRRDNRLSQRARTDLTDVARKLYQQQMVYRKKDGSFGTSPFEKSPGSVWVTGFTATWFGRALNVSGVGVDEGAFTDALRWLSNRQSSDGGFRESPSQPLDDPVEQEPVTLTALTLRAFIGSKSVVAGRYDNLINKALDWLAREVATAVDQKWDASRLAPCAAVLHDARHPDAARVTDLLKSLAEASDGRRRWRSEAEEADPKSPWAERSTRNARTTAWALQALLSQGHLKEAVETGRTLVSRLGDWTDSPQTLTAVPALVDLAARVSERGTTADVRFRCANQTVAFALNPKSPSLRQKLQVPENACRVDGEGFGLAVASVRTSRRTNVTGAWPRFILDPRIDAVSTPHRLQLSVCMGFVPLPGEERSGPVILGLRLPTGFVPDVDVPALKASGAVREGYLSTTGEPHLSMILPPMNGSETCLTVRAPRLYPVLDERPGVVTLVDSTDNTRRARSFFGGGASSACRPCGGTGDGACGASEGGCLVAPERESEFGKFKDNADGTSGAPLGIPSGSRLSAVFAFLLYRSSR